MTMREILFRGKTKNNEWVEGLYLTYDPKHYDHLESPSHVIVNNPEALGCGLCIQESEMTGENLDVYSDTVGQYTGLTDKNGTKIFEGDILRIRGDKEHPVLVVFHDFGWVCVMENQKYYRHRLENNSEKYEVIGNIHDNPELMEGK